MDKPKRERSRGLKENVINENLKNVDNYLGTFALDELESLKVCQFPSYAVINLDKRSGGGNHWIAIALYINDVFICDSLGTVLPDNTFPTQLVNFLYICSYMKKIHITKRLQQKKSATCGLYCIEFIHDMSVHHNIDYFLSSFSTNYKQNDQRIKFLTETI